MVDLLKRLMEANRTTGSQITTGDTRPAAPLGRRPHRQTLPPLRHPHPQADQPSYDGDERVTYWCPTCQPKWTPV